MVNLHKWVVCFLFTVLTFFAPKQIIAQNVLSFKNYSVENGLSDFTVNCIFQDSYGFIWIGTSNGLNRFDSYKIESIALDNSKQNFYYPKNFYTVFEDKQQNLLFGTDNGLYKYTRTTGTFELITGKDSSESKLNLSNYAIRNIVEDKSGNLWIGTYEGLNKVTPDSSVIIYKHDKENNNSINSDLITTLHLDGNGNVIIGTSDGFAIYNSTTDNFERYYHYHSDQISSPEQKYVTSIEEGPGNIIYLGTWGLGLYEFDLNSKKMINNFRQDPAKENGLSSNTIFALKQDNEGNLWIGTENGGLNKYDRKTERFTVHKHEDYFLNSISGNTIKCIMADNHNDLWIGTYMGGISKLDFNKIKLNHYQHLYNKRNSLSNNKVTSFEEIAKNDIWIGTDGGGINRFNPTTGMFKHIRFNENDQTGILTDVVMALEEIDNGNVWAGTYKEGINILNRQGKRIANHKMDLKDTLTLSGNNISSIFQDSYGRIWTGVSYDIPCLYRGNGKFTRIVYPDNSNHAVRDVRDFLEDKNGNVWMGSNGYLYKLESITDGKFNFKKYNIIKGTDEQFITTITALEQDKNEALWVGTNGRGLIRFVPSTNEVTHFTMEDGLPSNVIAGLTLYDDGSIWVSTGKGLVQVNVRASIGKDDFLLKSFDLHDGLQGDVFNIGAATTSSDGMLLFGGNGGFNGFYPWKIQQNDRVPPVYITDLQVNHQKVTKENDILMGKAILATNNIELSHNENTVSIYFTAVDFKNSDKILYKYKLKGFEDQWNYAGSERKATYTNLSPGTYTFHVQAANNDEIWNFDGAMLSIQVSPPWWLTYWALIIYVVTVTSVILLFRKYLLVKERKRNELRLNQVRSEKMQELNELKLQFFTNISHEIRTPLTLILGPVQELLNRWNYEPKQKLQLDLILRNTKRLFQLVDQLMDFRKLENQTLPFQPEKNDIVNFVKVIYGDFRHLANNKGVSYYFHSSHNSYSTYFDEDKIQKVVNNLITNAFKFTRSKGRIEVRLHIDEEKENYVIEVSDDGIGIEAEHIQKIFDPFYQAHGKYYKKFKGTGVGLALCKSLVEIMNGTIEVNSKKNGEIKDGFNTVFTVTCPLIDQHVLTEPNTTIETSGLQDENEIILESPEIIENDVSEIVTDLPTVLLVEDNPDVKTFIQSHLGEQYQFIFALNGKEGLNKANEILPDIIISDIIMPEMDGIEMCYNIKSSSQTSHIPIIILTAKNAEGSILEGLDTGADAYLTKPFNINVLGLYLKNILHAREKLHKLYQSDYSLTDLKKYRNNKDKDFLKTVIDKIKENISEFEFGVDELAKEVGMSRTNFYKKIKDLTGLTVNDFIKNLKLKVAANLLLKSDYNVNEVAYQIGFKDASYFSRCFKETFGSLPKEFVRGHNEKKGV